MEHKTDFGFSHIKLPELKFGSELTGKEANIIVLVESAEDAPEVVKAYLERERVQKDLKAKKTITLYSDKKEDNFEKCTVFLVESADKGSQDHVHAHTKKVQALGVKIAKEAKSLDESTLTLVIGNSAANALSEQLGVLLNAITLSSYEFDRRGKTLRSENKTNPIHLTSINVVGKVAHDNEENTFQFKSSLYSLLAREISSERPNTATTLWVRDVAKSIAETHSGKVKYHEIVGEDLEKQGLNLLYSVGKASAFPPALVSLHYQGNTQNPDAPALAIVGKGIVFDAGGLSIKTTSGMENMYLDKVGACNMLSIFRGVVELALPINLVCTVALAENVIGPKAYRNSDIITSLKGLTVEIKNTDAEGRLVLADAMTWTQKNHKVKQLIDLATLTGACSAALGDKIGGLFHNNKKLADKVLSLSTQVNEPFWALPLTDDNINYIKGNYSDLQNTALGKHMGASNAAAFLLQFIEKDVKWIHLDIAGPAHVSSGYSVYSKGATGFGVKLILTYLRNYSQRKPKVSQ